jgi:lysophospholipase L1-like esterase
MEPKGRPGTRHWSKATHLNAEDAVARQGDVDVVFLGESITEGWRGTSYGNPVGRKEGVPAIFKNIFTVEGGGKYEGLALGIASDTVRGRFMFCIVSQPNSS